MIIPIVKILPICIKTWLRAHSSFSDGLPMEVGQCGGDSTLLVITWGIRGGTGLLSQLGGSGWDGTVHKSHTYAHLASARSSGCVRNLKC